MHMELLAAAGGEAAPQTQSGFTEAMEQGGVIAWSILTVLVIMSVGSFYILITKMLEQNRILRQYKSIRTTFWRANSLSEGASKLEKNSAWRQLVDDGLVAEGQHSKMTAEPQQPHCRAAVGLLDRRSRQHHLARHREARGDDGDVDPAGCPRGRHGSRHQGLSPARGTRRAGNGMRARPPFEQY